SQLSAHAKEVNPQRLLSFEIRASPDAIFRETSRQGGYGMSDNFRAVEVCLSLGFDRHKIDDVRYQHLRTQNVFRLTSLEPSYIYPLHCPGAEQSSDVRMDGAGAASAPMPFSWHLKQKPFRTSDTIRNASTRVGRC